MNFTVNPSVFGSMLAVPSVVAEKHLKLASGDQIKVLLAFFKFSQDKDYCEKISSVTGVNAASVFECLEYWADCGILLCDSKKPNDEQQKNISDNKRIKKDFSASGKPTREEAVKRAVDDGELKFLFDEIQQKLNKPITTAQMITLVWLHDNYGLPASVILMAVEYAKNEDKSNFSYIEKVCVDWAEHDVCDVASAERRISRLYMRKTAWKIVSKTFGIDERKPSAKESEFVDKWVNQFGYTKDMLKIAYDKCIDSTGKLSFPYIDKIIVKWNANGVKRPQDIDESKPSAKSGKTDTSYDIGQIKSKSNNFDNIGW